MTVMGKILVLLNLALSVLLVAWAMGVYTQRIDWSTQKADATHAQGEVYRLRDQIAPQGGHGLWSAVTEAETRYQVSAQAFRPLEPLRYSNQKWYDTQLALLKDNPNPVKQPNYQNGQLVLDRTTALPMLVDAADKGKRPLRSLDSYTKAYDTNQDAIAKAMTELNKWLKEDTDLTVQISGDKTRTPELLGVRQLLALEQTKRQHVLDEQDYLKPLLVNSRVEAELLVKRRQALEARVEELKKTNVASGD